MLLFCLAQNAPRTSPQNLEPDSAAEDETKRLSAASRRQAKCVEGMAKQLKGTVQKMESQKCASSSHKQHHTIRVQADDRKASSGARPLSAKVTRRGGTSVQLELAEPYGWSHLLLLSCNKLRERLSVFVRLTLTFVAPTCALSANTSCEATEPRSHEAAKRKRFSGGSPRIHPWAML